MASTRVIHACGHAEMISVYGNRTSQTAALARQRELDCQACTITKRAEQEKADKAEFATWGPWPELTANQPSVVARAERLRIATVLAAVAHIATTAPTNTTPEQLTRHTHTLLTPARAITQAAWWLSNTTPNGIYRLSR